MIKKIACALAGTVLLCVPPSPGMAYAAVAPAPTVMAALGDSISAAFNACGWYVACPSRSWSTGDSTVVRSHYLRLLSIGFAIKDHNLNFAVAGSTSADLADQARKAARRKADYVTITIGAQDACRGSVSQMTPVAVYRSRIDAALRILRPTGAHVFVASIPDLKRLWQVGKDNSWARVFWAIGRICPAMLANPTSTARKDVIRRNQVRERIMAYNEQLRAACVRYGPNCHHDRGAVFAFPFTLKHISGWDFFHPNAEGQRALARVTFNAGLFLAVPGTWRS